MTPFTQGVGKDVLFEKLWMPRVLGYQVCHQTEDVNTILGKHANGLENSVFVLFDEANNRNLGSVLDRSFLQQHHSLVSCQLHLILTFA
mmetsp:Transcript_35311/g.89149  ORF Transcript_35311/g.89149 Transcript_35311/m.89149 type:complete len:89 (-) Transcript_35311:760-1026(-)